MKEVKKTLTSHQKKAIRSNLIGYSFILPNLIGYAIFVFIPVIFSFILSVMKWDGSQAPMEFVGLQNFAQIFSDRIFVQSFVHTIQYALLTVFPTLVFALLLAVLLNHKLKGIAIFRTALYFPYIASIVAVGAVWNMLFQPDFGPINEFLKFIGISKPPRWVVDVKWAMVAISVVSIWKYMGYYMIVYLAALQGISGSLYEAAGIDGANGFQKLRYITIPMLTPTTFFVLIMLTIQCFKVFDLVYVMTGGGPGNATKTLVNYIYEKAFTTWQFGPASAGAIVLFSVVLVITLIQFAGEKKWSKDLM
ncbi:carbohydrate ABC transporter permease [Lacrimispora saccharolytica]|uniref:Binding-protein-dependent transport systems inner membrane component n=1 Tax=Lacrimispora saccharolytica (strain ATCC 35040 / DSM 2544 / NRCC 2533 / WM1) TaxID=610130 RepID=D9R055_LACSW|nr:sugar ABC transporter permease [Lacrimispora saccharolytica]ADL04506.1 binding-protein-dependent transport systems inner membrane component [[Clostridium] saccharolyticum WM1]QRV21237.1 sugar ABC transporter permease [Lacrimispora saccharolytica]